MSLILSQDGSNNLSGQNSNGLREQAIVTIDLDPYQCQQIWPDEDVIGSEAGSRFICEGSKIIQTRNYPINVAMIFKKHPGYNVIVESLGENTGRFNVLCFTDKSI